MTRFPERTLTAALLATVVVSVAGGVARARTSFDGIWSVTIITDSGACDRAYRAPVRIINGQVASEGDQSFNIFGHVQPSGRVGTGFDGTWSVTIITDSGACDLDCRAPA